MVTIIQPSLGNKKLNCLQVPRHSGGLLQGTSPRGVGSGQGGEEDEATYPRDLGDTSVPQREQGIYLGRPDWLVLST